MSETRPESPRRAALTFDTEHPDRRCSSTQTVRRILDLLAQNEARATFFIQGRWALAHAELAREIAEAGHLIGNHSHFHAPMLLLSDDGVRTDVMDAHDALVQTTGVDPRPWFRCPFGNGHSEPRIVSGLERLGYHHVHWNIEVEDWEPSRTGEDIARDVLAGIDRHGDDAIVLLHSWSDGTGDALLRIIDGLRERRIAQVRVDALARAELAAE